MGTYYATDLGATNMTVEQLDAIALRGGKVGEIGYGHATRGKVPDRHGYGFAWIGSRGMGNYGDLVLVARSPRAAEHLRQGKISIWMKDYGLNYQEVDSLYSIARETRHGLEPAVLKYCAETRDCWAAWAAAPAMATNRARARWERDWKMPTSGEMSIPRWEAVRDIMGKWLKLLRD